MSADGDGSDDDSDDEERKKNEDQMEIDGILVATTQKERQAMEAAEKRQSLIERQQLELVDKAKQSVGKSKYSLLEAQQVRMNIFMMKKKQNQYILKSLMMVKNIDLIYFGGIHKVEIK